MLIEGATVDLEQENQRLRAELQAQTQELRELARGIHPLRSGGGTRVHVEIPCSFPTPCRRFLRGG
jgi:hypothetical protein